MKLKDIKGYIIVDCDILVEDATNDEFNYVDDFPFEDKKKMEQYKNAALVSIAPGNHGRVLVTVSINNGVFTNN